MFEELEKEKIHSSKLSEDKKDSSQLLSQEDSIDSSGTVWFEEEGKEDETIEFLTLYLNIIPVGLVYKYVLGMYSVFGYEFETKEDAINFIEKVKSDPDGMEQRCEELGLYTNTGPYWQKHVNFAHLFKLDYDSLTRLCLINKEYVPDKKSFEDKHFKLTLNGITVKCHLSLKEIYMRVLNENICERLTRFKHIEPISINLPEPKSNELKMMQRHPGRSTSCQSFF